MRFFRRPFRPTMGESESSDAAAAAEAASANGGGIRGGLARHPSLIPRIAAARMSAVDRGV